MVKRLTGKIATWATCAITQLGFVRIGSTSGVFSRALAPDQAQTALAGLCDDKQHLFLAELPSLLDCDFSMLQGPRQTTDAYLLALAHRHDCTLLTLDKRLAAAFPDGPVELLGT